MLILPVKQAVNGVELSGRGVIAAGTSAGL
jgi:hypothetical protein